MALNKKYIKEVILKKLYGVFILLRLSNNTAMNSLTWSFCMVRFSFFFFIKPVASFVVKKYSQY